MFRPVGRGLWEGLKRPLATRTERKPSKHQDGLLLVLAGRALAADTVRLSLETPFATTLLSSSERW